MLRVASEASGQRAGSYRLLEPIAAGGMGIVHLARHELLGTTVAAKVLRAELASEPALVRRFLDEGRVAARVRHPNSIQILDLLTLEDGRPCIVMELLEGETLESRASAGRLGAREALRILVEVCDALSAAHAVGVIHRDIKAENVLLVADGGAERVKVLDFGIAKRLYEEGYTSPGNVMGTPDYMAPEQILGKPVDARTDLYAVGVLAYRLLAGRLPFAGRSAIDAMRAQLSEQPERPAGIGDGLWALVLKAMAKDPAGRFSSAAELAGALRAEAGAAPAAESSLPGPRAPAARPAPLPAGAGHRTGEAPTLVRARIGARLCDGVLEVCFGTEKALRQAEREQIEKGMLFVPVVLPVCKGPIGLRLIGPQGERPLLQADVVRVVDARLATDWGLVPGLALSVRRPAARSEEAERFLALARSRPQSDLYGLLGIGPSAGWGLVDAAARRLRSEVVRLAAKASPSQRAELQGLCVQIERARATLCDPEARASHDASLGNYEGVARALASGLSRERLEQLHAQWSAESPERSGWVRPLLRAAGEALAERREADALELLRQALTADPLDPALHERHARLQARLSAGAPKGAQSK
jgi:serine/threonine-protein kinase